MLRKQNKPISISCTHLCYLIKANYAEHEAKVEDVATGITAKAMHRNNRFASLKDALKNVVEQLNERGDTTSF